MSEDRKYFDLRSEFWHRHWEMATDYATYLERSEPERAQRWAEMEERIPPLTDAQIARLSWNRRTLHVLLHSGVWCGDCVRQGPMIRRIAAACGEKTDLRVIDREQSPELRDELRILGGTRVPVVVFLSEDFFELGRFGDRMLAIYRSKAQRELGSACDPGILPPPSDELAAEQGEWVDVFERMLLMLRVAPMYRERYGD